MVNDDIIDRIFAVITLHVCSPILRNFLALLYSYPFEHILRVT